MLVPSPQACMHLCFYFKFNLACFHLDAQNEVSLSLINVLGESSNHGGVRGDSKAIAISLADLCKKKKEPEIPAGIAVLQ